MNYTDALMHRRTDALMYCRADALLYWCTATLMHAKIIIPSLEFMCLHRKYYGILRWGARRSDGHSGHEPYQRCDRLLERQEAVADISVYFFGMSSHTGTTRYNTQGHQPHCTSVATHPRETWWICNDSCLSFRQVVTSLARLAGARTIRSSCSSSTNAILISVPKY